MNIQLVSTSAELIEACAQISAYREWAIDTEFDRNRNRYGFNLCVVQIATPDQVFIIDPLTISPRREETAAVMEPLLQLIRSSKWLKIMHACSEDIRLFDKLGARPAGVFDTQVAAKMLSVKANSFNDLLQAELGVVLNKKLQTSNWFKRPLDEERISYLAGDVRFLLELKQRLSSRLYSSGRNSWFEEEMQNLLSFETAPNYDADIAPFVRRKEFWQLESGGKYIARRLWALRDETARMRDVPPFYIMADSLLYALASRTEALLPGQIHRLSPYMQERKLIQVFNEAQETARSGDFFLPEIKKDRPRRYGNVRMSNEQVAELFKPVIDEISKQYGDDAAQLLLPDSAVKRIAFAGTINVLPGYVQSILQELRARFPAIAPFF